MTPTAIGSELGGSVDGPLTEYAVLDEYGLVSTPPHLSDTEAATLPCTAVTAWHSLVEVKPAIRFCYWGPAASQSSPSNLPKCWARGSYTHRPATKIAHA